MEALTSVPNSNPFATWQCHGRDKAETNFPHHEFTDAPSKATADWYGLPVADCMTDMKKHILVADDEPNMLDSLGFILKAQNYRVTTAGDGQEALGKICDALENHSPIDLLITDIRLPRLTGLQLIDELNRFKIRMPIFAITGYGDKALVIELMRTGCADYLDKPFKLKEFVRRVGLLFEKTRA